MPTNNTDSDSPEPKLTEDGSHTLYSDQFQQHYHNPGGSVSESRHIFFEKNGLLEALETRDELDVFETGFGSGLNLLLLLDSCLEISNRPTIRFHAVEAYPITPETFKSLNYRQFINHPELANRVTVVFEELQPGHNEFDLPAGLKLNLFAGFFEDYDGPSGEIDFIFHDPFSPEVNSDLWSGDVFRMLKRFASSDCMLSTYCAASRARGAMAWAGWYVAREEGALGKREMTLASLNPDRLGHLDRIDEERFAKRYEEDDF